MSNDEATDNASAAAEAVDPPVAPPAKVGVLHLALQALLNDVGRAFNFGDPTAFIAQAELAFKQTVADAFHELEQRIAAIETRQASATLGGAPAVPTADAKPVNAADGETNSRASPWPLSRFFGVAGDASKFFGVAGDASKAPGSTET